jgi:2-polyprenyl-3-methyl-5-hydroxy-6-metoxy-1,4-benzoquinol methylase
VAGEELLEHFGSRRFDIAYATNALDHSADPVAIISNMVALVRPGGAVLLRHKRNEGQSARYGGLHQWNFDVAEDRLVLWNDAFRVDVGRALGARVAATAWISDGEAVARLAVGEPRR